MPPSEESLSRMLGTMTLCLLADKDSINTQTPSKFSRIKRQDCECDLLVTWKVRVGQPNLLQELMRQSDAVVGLVGELEPLVVPILPESEVHSETHVGFADRSQTVHVHCDVNFHRVASKLWSESGVVILQQITENLAGFEHFGLSV